MMLLFIKFVLKVIFHKYMIYISMFIIIKSTLF